MTRPPRSHRRRHPPGHLVEPGHRGHDEQHAARHGRRPRPAPDGGRLRCRRRGDVGADRAALPRDIGIGPAPFATSVDDLVTAHAQALAFAIVVLAVSWPLAVILRDHDVYFAATFAVVVAVSIAISVGGIAYWIRRRRGDFAWLGS